MTALALAPTQELAFSVAAQPLERIWRYNGVTLRDPLPGHPLDAVRRLHAIQYAALTNAKVDGPSYEGHLEVYVYTASGGVFG